MRQFVEQKDMLEKIIELESIQKIKDKKLPVSIYLSIQWCLDPTEPERTGEEAYGEDNGENSGKKQRDKMQNGLLSQSWKTYNYILNQQREVHYLPQYW